MSPHVLLNLLNEFGEKRSNVRLVEHLSTFHNKFNKFSNTGAQNVRFYLSYDPKTTLKSRFCVKR